MKCLNYDENHHLISIERCLNGSKSHRTIETELLIPGALLTPKFYIKSRRPLYFKQKIGMTPAQG